MESLGAGPARVVAVIPGRERRVTAPCVACGAGDANGVLRVRAVVDGIELVLCLDYFACVTRYRRRGLEGER